MLNGENDKLFLSGILVARIIHKLVRFYVSPGPGGRRAHKMRAVVLLHNVLCDPGRTAAAPLPRWMIKN